MLPIAFNPLGLCTTAIHTNKVRQKHPSPWTHDEQTHNTNTRSLIAEVFRGVLSASLPSWRSSSPGLHIFRGSSRRANHRGTPAAINKGTSDTAFESFRPFSVSKKQSKHGAKKKNRFLKTKEVVAPN